jgi:hypothetical protein
VVITSAGIMVKVAFDWARRRPKAALEAMLDRLTELPAFGELADEVRAVEFRKRPGLRLEEFGDAGVRLLTEALEILLEHPPEE